MVQRQVDRAASQSHRVGRPVLSPLDRSGQGGHQASGQQASGRPAVGKTLWPSHKSWGAEAILGFGILLAQCQQCRIEQIA